MLKCKKVEIGETNINICRDNDDNYIIEAAVKVNADAIITGDKDLLVLKKYNNVSILSPREFYMFFPSEN